MTDTKKYKLLPTGEDTFSEVITQNKYYVDKTSYLRSVFAEDGSSVLLFTRPHRFGKSLLMDMFADFLRLNVNDPSDTSFQQNLFKGKSILQDKEFVDKFMGQFPVLYLSLKDVHGRDFYKAYRKLASVVSYVGNQFSCLNNSTEITEDDKDKLKILQKYSLLRNIDNEDYLTGSLFTL